MVDKTVDERAVDIAEPEGKTFYLCVTSSKAPMPIGTMLRANRKESGNYWFDEVMDKLNPVHGTFAMPVHWFSEITSDENDAVAIGKIRDELAAVNAEHTKDMQALDATIKQMKLDIAVAMESGGGGVAENFLWKQDTEYQFKDIFKMSDYQRITPLNGYRLLWIRQAPATNVLEYKTEPTNTEYGLSTIAWREVWLIHTTDMSRPTVKVVSHPADDGHLFISVTYNEPESKQPA